MTLPQVIGRFCSKQLIWGGNVMKAHETMSDTLIMDHEAVCDNGSWGIRDR